VAKHFQGTAFLIKGTVWIGTDTINDESEPGGSHGLDWVESPAKLRTRFKHLTAKVWLTPRAYCYQPAIFTSQWVFTVELLCILGSCRRSLHRVQQGKRCMSDTPLFEPRRRGTILIIPQLRSRGNNMCNLKAEVIRQRHPRVEKRNGAS
jgi:hypothetical protein